MSSYCEVKIICPNNKWFKNISFLRHNGVHITQKTDTARTYSGKIREKKISQFYRSCSRRGMKCVINGGYGERSAKYRAEFFEKTTSLPGDKYFCAYCGRLVRKDQVTIDHIYPVGQVKRNIKLQKKLKRKGLENVNDIRNLAPACRKCNERKGKSTGSWIVRGKIGRHQWLWGVRHALRIAAVAVLIYIAYKHGIITYMYKTMEGLICGR